MPWILIALAVVARLLPHPFNLTPVGGLGLYAGATASPRIAWLVPLVAMLPGDLAGGMYDPAVLLCVYLGLLAGPAAGRLLLSRRRTLPRFAGAVAASGIAFFVISNLGNWFAFYPHTALDLLRCYLNGLPLLGNTLAGDALFAGLFLGTDELMRRALGRHAAEAA